MSNNMFSQDSDLDILGTPTALHDASYQVILADNNGDIVTDYFDADGVFLHSTSRNPFRMPGNLYPEEMQYAPDFV